MPASSLLLPVSSSTNPEASTTTVVARSPSSTTTSVLASSAPQSTLPQYSGSIRELDPSLIAQITPTSWREGCPVAPAELRLVEVTHVSYEGEATSGELIVHRDHAEGIAEVFAQLYDARFPVASVLLVDVFAGDDGKSMQANNTSAFNCREVASKPGVWSNHAFGTAIDVNPLVNPFVQGDLVDPPDGRPFVDRALGEPGMIVADDVVVSAFASIGWAWGGTWSSAKDYQHFSANGR
ncbi:MAG: M15 family metallopeptidase [Acidimicrobiales bacterium]